MPGTIPDLGPHAVFIWAAYAVMTVAVAGLTIGIVLDDRKQKRLLAELEKRGVRRRSAETGPARTAKSRPKPLPQPEPRAKPRVRAKAAPSAGAVKGRGK
jgi:heme exporter protein D